MNIIKMEYVLIHNKPEIHIFGRDSNFKKHRIIVINFKPYFFISNNDYINNKVILDPILSKCVLEKTELKCYNTEDYALKIILINPKDVVNIRKLIEKNNIKTYEADVMYILRFTLDKHLFNGLKFDESNSFYIGDDCYVDEKNIFSNNDLNVNIYPLCYDIEVEFDETVPNYLNPTKKILAIAYYDPIRLIANSFVLSPLPLLNKNNKNRKEKTEIRDLDERYELGNKLKVVEFEYDNEKIMLQDTVKFIASLNIDVLDAFNGNKFDHPYYFARLDYLHIDYTILTKMKGYGYDKYSAFMSKSGRPIIKGLIFFDSMEGYKKLTLSQEDSYSLDNLSNKNFGVGKVNYKDEGYSNLMELYYKNYPMFKYYNIIDVIAEYALIVKKKIINFFYFVKTVSGADFNDVLFNSRIVDAIFLETARRREEVLPSKKYKEKDNNEDTDNEEDEYEESLKKREKIRGAIVLQPPRRGIFNKVVTVDLSQAYPSVGAMMNLGSYKIEFKGEVKKNICIEKIKLNKDNVSNNINDYIGPIYIKRENTTVLIDKRHIGIIAQVFMEKMKIRKELKKKFRETKSDVDFVIQEVFKFLVNTVYGILLFAGFRLYDKINASIITLGDRETLMCANEKLTSFSFVVIYGDTDSLHYCTDKEKIEDIVKEANNIMGELNESIDNYFKTKYNVDKCYMEFDLEKVFYKIMFKYKKGTNEVAKKMYVGRVAFLKGVYVDKLEVKGLYKSDLSKFVRMIRENIFNIMLSDDDSNEKLIVYLRNEINKIRNLEYPPSYVSFAKGINRPLEKYKQNYDWVRGAKWFNENAHIFKSSTRYGYGDKPKYIYTDPSKFPKEYKPSDIIALDSDGTLPIELYKTLNIDKTLDSIMKKIEDIVDMVDIHPEDLLNIYRIKKKSLFDIR